MHADRLERMAKLLEADAANEKGVKFDLGLWAGPSEPQVETETWGLISGVWKDKAKAVPVSCDTTACAMGLAAISGEFAAEGLTYVFEGRLGGGYTLIPEMGTEQGFGAAAELFGIEYEAATYLFDPEHYEECPTGATGERFVAQRIRDFVNGIVDEEFYSDC